ncbi:MAG TPA: peroxiredoxin [Burkholderiales bacterium]|nr:peroxiredoxin [Burkholderiales bacterium]
MIKWLLVGLVIAAGLLLWRVSAYSKRRAPSAGEPAPDLSLPDQDGKSRSLSEFRGKWLVLYFYPKDDTPGCTRQACAFRDDRHKLAALGAEVVGVSVDDVESHLDFAKEYRLPFPLLADAGGAVAASYGSLRDLGLVKFARRNTFLIDPQGRVAKVYLSASAAGNSGEVLEDLKRLQRK